MHEHTGTRRHPTGLNHYLGFRSEFQSLLCLHVYVTEPKDNWLSYICNFSKGFIMINCIYIKVFTNTSTEQENQISQQCLTFSLDTVGVTIGT